MDGFELPAPEVWPSFYLINKCTNNVWLQPEGLLFVFSSACYFSLSWGRWMQCAPSHTVWDPF